MRTVKVDSGNYTELGIIAVYRDLRKFFEGRVMPGDARAINHCLRACWKEEYSTLTIGRDVLADAHYRVSGNEMVLANLYEHIWKSCSTPEKLLLLDLAREGLYNYKNEHLTIMLYLKGLLKYDTDGHLAIMSLSFRNYIVGQGETKVTADMEKEVRTSSTWKSFQTPVLILIICIGIFFFVTQENLANRAGALIPTLTGAVTLIASLFGKKVEKGE